jgi:hypothetical protein
MKVSINQIYYLEEQRPKLEFAFTPFLNSSNTGKKWFEYFVFLDQYQNRKDWANQLTGFISWKYGMKTGISGDKFARFIEDNPGKDVYFINPFYIESLMYKSQWEGAAYHHPGIIELTEFIFTEIGYDKELIHRVQDLNVQLYANYWVGSEMFWEKYIAFTKPIYEFIENCKDTEFQKKIMNRADNEIEAPYIPFIMERLFTLILLADRSISFASYPYSEEENKNKYKMVYDFFPILEKIKESEGRNKINEEEKKFRTRFRDINEKFDQEMKAIFSARDNGNIFKVIYLFITLKSMKDFSDLYTRSKLLKPKLNFLNSWKLQFTIIWRLKLFGQYVSVERFLHLLKKAF